LSALSENPRWRQVLRSKHSIATIIFLDIKGWMEIIKNLLKIILKKKVQFKNNMKLETQTFFF
jgi:hypothetical protein